MNTIGYSATISKTKERGLIVAYLREIPEGWKVQLSLDHRCEIVKIDENQLSADKLENHEYYFNRLLRDICCENLQTRKYAAQILCDFIEFDSKSIPFEFLTNNLKVIINRLIEEKNPDVGDRLAEAIHEYLCLEELNEDHRIETIKTLAKTNSDWMFSYLDDYKEIQEVNDYYSNRSN